MQDTRFESIKLWLKGLPNELGIDPDSISPASSDASFRRYFRVIAKNGLYSSFIVMDAPVDKEDSRPFVHIADLLLQAHINVPKIFEMDLQQGFLLLSDLGTKTLFSTAHEENTSSLYKDATNTLINIQKNTKTTDLPLYDATLLRRELDLFPEWYLSKHLQYQLNDKEKIELDSIFDQLIEQILLQPTVFVHRDYHSRNLMITENNGLGVLDFQDAVIGPITYDLVSIFRDAYVHLEEETQIDYVVRYWESAKKENLPVSDDFGEFYKTFEWMGLQRHLKVLGIFARLFYRDGKDAYLKDLPLVLQYTEKAAQRYSVFRPLVRLLDASQNKERPTGLTF